MTTTIAKPTNLDTAKALYEADPNWHWVKGVQKFVKWDDLSAERQQAFIAAAEGLTTFLAAFERDIAFSTLNNIMLALGPISMDPES